MRLWSIHPEYLDAKGLTAVWREALLARKVLEGKTKGYRKHPQLTRFRKNQDPRAAIAFYLREIFTEAERRGYRFDRSKLDKKRRCSRIPVTAGQVAYEFLHLKRKLKFRDPHKFSEMRGINKPRTHPAFIRRAGGIEQWELPWGGRRAVRGERSN